MRFFRLRRKGQPIDPFCNLLARHAGHCRFAAEFITRNYYEIGKPSIEGDLVLLINAQNRVMHSSVYLADNIVFTKNGINFAQPWVTMRINDMVGYFSALEPGDVFLSVKS